MKNAHAALRALLLPLPAVLRIQSGLGKVGIRIFEQRVLIAVPKLSLQPDISVRAVVFRFTGAFFCILIDFIFSHDFCLAAQEGERTATNTVLSPHFIAGVLSEKPL